MSSRIATRLIGALAVPALGLGLAACGSEEPAEGTDGGNEEVAALSPHGGRPGRRRGTSTATRTRWTRP